MPIHRNSIYKSLKRFLLHYFNLLLLFCSKNVQTYYHMKIISYTLNNKDNINTKGAN